MGANPIYTLGASNHSDKERAANDYYGTNPETTRALLKVQAFNTNVWEPCAGHHLIVNELVKEGYIVKSTDLVDYGFGDELGNFLDFAGTFDGDIITNPPYYLAQEFVQKALDVITDGHRVCMLLRTLFLEGNKRYEQLFSKGGLKTVYVFSNRQVCSATDEFTDGSSMSYSWFVWEKGYTGKPTIEWLSTK